MEGSDESSEALNSYPPALVVDQPFDINISDKTARRRQLKHRLVCQKSNYSLEVRTPSRDAGDDKGGEFLSFPGGQLEQHLPDLVRSAEEGKNGIDFAQG